MQAARLLVYLVLIVSLDAKRRMKTHTTILEVNPLSVWYWIYTGTLHLVTAGVAATYNTGRRIPLEALTFMNHGVGFFLHEPRKATKQRRIIEPEQFAVIRSFQRMDAGLYVLAKPIQVASNSFMFSGNGNSGPKSMMTIMKLQSEKQPQLVELKCAVYADPVLSNFVSLNEIQKTLGDIATLRFE